MTNHEHEGKMLDEAMMRLQEEEIGKRNGVFDTLNS